MGKEKLKTKKGITVITNALGKFERLNYEELKVLINGTVDGLVNVGVEQKRTLILSAEITGWVALSHYLGMALSERDILTFIMSTLNIAHDCERHGLRVDNLCWSPERIFVDPQGKVRMLYWPVTTLERQPETPLSFYARFCGILANSNADRAIVGQYTQYFYQRDFMDMPRFFQLMTDIMERWRGNHRKEKKHREEKAATPSHELVPDKHMNISGAWLERVGKQQTIMLEHQTTLIGRDPGSCHIALPAHTCISRIHAMIENKDGQYYLTDLGSRNGTFLQADRLKPNAKVALDDGDRIRFHDVAYIFHKREMSKTVSIHLLR